MTVNNAEYTVIKLLGKGEGGYSYLMTDCAGTGKGGGNMRIPLEDRLPYTALTLIVLAAFYGVYFAKVLAQKRRGIQTRQIGRRKEKSIHTVEVLMSIATLGAPIAQLLSIVLDWNHLPAGVRLTGFCVGMLGDVIFLLSVLCTKHSRWGSYSNPKYWQASRLE